MAAQCLICCETVRPRQVRRFTFKVNSTPMTYINFIGLLTMSCVIIILYVSNFNVFFTYDRKHCNVMDVATGSTGPAEVGSPGSNTGLLLKKVILTGCVTCVFKKNKVRGKLV